MTELVVENLMNEYGSTRALDGVSFSVADGEFFTLVGPSGCGKTTLLRALAGFDTPTNGTIAFDGREMSGVPPEARGVGVVFQNYALFPHMTVAENVGYGLRFTDPPGGDSDERVRELLELVDLAGMGDRRPEALSGGQQQRVALARALAPAPGVLLLDEPMSALDAGLRERLRVELASIQSELGVTTVYVTHDQEEALAISDRVAVMTEGRIERIGSPRTIYRNPGTRFVAEFLGDNNVFEGTVRPGPETGTDERKGGSNAEEPTEKTVAVGGERFAIATDAEVGERVVVCVRPERLRVESGYNRFRARVASNEFLGQATRVHLDWEGRAITLRTSGIDALDDTVELGFDPADARVLEE